MSNIVKLREILVYNQPKQKFDKFQTATDKWSDVAELVKASSELEVDNINNMRAVIQSTQNTLELPNALIPDGPQKIFLFEAKVKSGAVNYERLSYNELRRLAKSKKLSDGLGSNPTKGELIDVLEGSAGIKKEKISKTSPKGRVTNKIVKTDSKNTSEIKANDKKILDAYSPSLNERINALEKAFETLIGGMYAVCSDFVQPTVKHESVIKEDTDIFDLEREADQLRVR